MCAAKHDVCFAPKADIHVVIGFSLTIFFGCCDWQVGHAVRSNPLSGALLQKTGIMAKIRRDFRNGEPMIRQNLDTENLCLTQEARETAGFSRESVVKSLEIGLDGWRGSAVCPLLRPVSLLTGNFTGNFGERRHSGARRL